MFFIEQCKEGTSWYIPLVEEWKEGQFVLFVLMIGEGTVTHQDGIFPDQTDIFPLYHHILTASEKAKEPLSPVDDHRHDFGCLGIDLDIINKADTTSVGIVDDLIVPQFGHSTAIHKKHRPSDSIVYHDTMTGGAKI